METTYDLYMIKTQHMQFINYAYLGIDKASRNAFVVDPSWDLSQLVALLDECRAELKCVLLTHSHFDHTNMVNKLEALYRPSVYMSRVEAEFYRYRNARLVTLEDAAQIRIGETAIIALLTPGHTRGSVCYLSERDLFTGDTIFIEGCGLCDGEGGSAEDMYYSIRRLMRIVPSHVRVYPGHSFREAPGQEMGYLHQWNVYFQIDDIEQFVRFRNRKNRMLIEFQ